MKRLLCSALLLLAVTGCAKPDWKVHEQADQNFRVKFPAEPKLTEQHVNAGSMPLTVKAWEADFNGCHFAVATCEYHQAVQEDGCLDGAVSGEVKGLSGKEVSRGPITLGTHKGRTFEAEVSDGKAIVHGRTYLVYKPGTKSESTLYELMVGESKGANKPEVDEFFKSFELIKP